MTGFGAAEAAHEGLRVRVETRTVNNRGLKITTRAPSVADAYAHKIDEVVRAVIERGTVWVNVALQREATGAPGRIVPEVLADYARQFKAAAADRDPPYDALLRLPGVVEQENESALADDEVETILGAVRSALGALVIMREREGAATSDDLRGHVERLTALAETVETRVPQAVREHQERLRERVTELLDGAGEVPPEILAREVAVLADKADVAEEVARLRSHADQTRAALTKGGPVGRRLDFLAQEMGREANTIGSKSSDALLGEAVVELKLVVERVKEQAANLE
jgi:uncharacterized protein (TIGR00255 family)